MSWIFYTILALIFFVIYDLASRRVATRSENPQVFAAIYGLFVAVMAPILFFLDPSLPQGITPQVILMTIIGLVVWGLFGRFEYFARANTEASVFSIILKLAPVLNFFLSLVVLGETWSTNKLIGISLIIIANISLFIGTSRKSVISNKGLYYSILISVLLAVGWLFDTINVKSWGVGVFSIMSFLVVTLVSSFFPTIKINDIKKEFSLTPWYQIFFLGFFNLMGYGLLLKALMMGEASNIIPITSSSTPFVVVFGILLLGERKNITRKIFASLLAVLAIYLMR